jgi:hypothetical protein
MSWRTFGREFAARGLAALVAVVATVLCSLTVAARAGATEAEPLKITKFTLQTTSAVQTPVNHDSFGFVQEPYSFTQAGGYPDSLTATIEFESEDVNTLSGLRPVPTRDPKDVVVSSPPGLLGNPTAVPRCPLKQVLAYGIPCPASTQVGIAVVHLGEGVGLVGPIVNVTPEAGQSAEFAIETITKVNFLLTGHVVRTPEGYGLSVVSNGILSNALISAETTFWGVPAAEVHDPERGLFCLRQDTGRSWSCGFIIFGYKNGKTIGLGNEKSDEPLVPFLIMPTDCALGGGTATVKADSWEEPGVYTSATASWPGVTDCNLLPFAPSVSTEPDTMLAGAPVGASVKLVVPQSREANKLAAPQVRSAVVTLPLGMSINPGAVDGIQACEESGPEGIDFTGPESEEVGLNGERQLASGHCPRASILGTAEAVTPLLSEPVKGHVYLARPGCGGAGQSPCTEQDALDGNLYKLYLELGGTGPLANTGVHLKIPGEVQANPRTGQLTSRFEGFLVGDPPHFEGNPQLPFSELIVRLNGAPPASLANPSACGPALTSAALQPWAMPGTTPEGQFMAGLADATPSSFFEVGGCDSPPVLRPGFVAGTASADAGQFAPFTLTITRKDREQFVKGLQVHTPPGLLGVLASVSLCEEAEANAGTCPQASKIGTTRVATGAGEHPFEVEGNIYLTGPYCGPVRPGVMPLPSGVGCAPFGLSVVTHAVAGPFNLGLVVVRARIDIDPNDSSLWVTVDDSGPYAVPQILLGVPLRLQRITASVDRQRFMFNPTSCKAQQVAATVGGVEGAVASVSMPFAASRCGMLGFKPTFKVSTSGRTSRARGASLDVKLSYPRGAMGTDANIARVKVSLPIQLPSRLSTLQKACPVQTFNADPAACPRASIVGIARTTTPLLPVQLSGPAYFVSFGGEAFPQLIVVLEGDGLRVDLKGNTFISKGITSSTFATVPDVPVSSFELYLPQGKQSALSANGDLCKSKAKLVMPTEFVAQNGRRIKQRTKIAVSDCGKAKRHRRNGRR